TRPPRLDRRGDPQGSPNSRRRQGRDLSPCNSKACGFVRRAERLRPPRGCGYRVRERRRIHAVVHSNRSGAADDTRFAGPDADPGSDFVEASAAAVFLALLPRILVPAGGQQRVRPRDALEQLRIGLESDLARGANASFEALASFVDVPEIVRGMIQV